MNQHCLAVAQQNWEQDKNLLYVEKDRNTTDRTAARTDRATDRNSPRAAAQAWHKESCIVWSRLLHGHSTLRKPVHIRGVQYAVLLPRQWGRCSVPHKKQKLLAEAKDSSVHSIDMECPLIGAFCPTKRLRYMSWSCQGLSLCLIMVLSCLIVLNNSGFVSLHTVEFS